MNGSAPHSGHVSELDGVRGIACLSIVVLHCLLGIATPAPGSVFAVAKSWSMPFLIGGVDLFFILSGLLIGGILMDARESGTYYRPFWVRRLARTLPVNLVLVASYAIALAIQARWQFPQWSVWALLPPLHSPLWYATYTQSLPIATSGWGPRWMGITWSLAIEEQFYLLFPFVVRLLSRRALIRVSVVAVLVSPFLFAWAEWATGDSTVGYVLLPCRMSSLFLGVLIACILRDERALALARRYRMGLDGVALLLLYATCLQWTTKLHFRFIDRGWSFAAALFHSPLEYFVLCILMSILILRIFIYDDGPYRRVLRSRPLSYCGLISYAFYMYHQAVNGTLHGFIFDHAPQITNLSELAVGILVVSMAAGLSILSYVAMERPIRRWGRRFTFDGSTLAKPPVPTLQPQRR